MKEIKTIIFLICAISLLFASNIQAQEACPSTECCYPDAYDDSNSAVIWSAALPIGAIVIAAIIIATTNHHHHRSCSSYSYSGCKSHHSYYSSHCQ